MLRMMVSEMDAGFPCSAGNTMSAVHAASQISLFLADGAPASIMALYTFLETVPCPTCHAINTRLAADYDRQMRLPCPLCAEMGEEILRSGDAFPNLVHLPCTEYGVSSHARMSSGTKCEDSVSRVAMVNNLTIGRSSSDHCEGCHDLTKGDQLSLPQGRDPSATRH
jgi:hypothetical protein